MKGKWREGAKESPGGHPAVLCVGAAVRVGPRGRWLIGGVPLSRTCRLELVPRTVTKGERGEGGINWEFGINRYTLLYIK